ncbi:uncharacterized protein F4817DRAFT_311077 [Daldinia loculata]|uniref:uncharacterized protein n=1 Tax=Daldinia loculata TaxID=103429 RepID=UPI0020C26E18|nr:uncharacterized protein F4817DRAFT_311077 [Daldinia loculata]KAI1652196.1 hypothetical protein F4817DRAFT_311077 [Daldinia loculata]
MTTSGSSPFSGTNQFTSDSGMLPPSFAASNEFDFYEDAHLGTNLFDFTSGELLDTGLYDDPKPFPPGLGQPEQVNPNRTLPLPSHRGSASSSSSLISGNSISAKTSQSSAEAMMTDEPFSGWNLEHESRHTDANFMFDTIDPTTMEMSRVFDFDSASSSPSPATNGLMQESPVAANSMSNAPAAKRIKGHHKTQSQHSITKSMNGLKTSGSREGSPTSNMIISQETSPAAMLNNSPSPDNITSHLGTMSNQQNPLLSWPPTTGPWANRVAPKPPFRRDPKGILANSLPPYSPQISLAPAQRPRLVVQPTPLKSRVETQIPIKLTIHALPPGIKRLHLPTHTISKPKLLAKPGAARSPDMLELYTMLVCTSAMQDPMKLQRAFRRAAVAGHDIASLKRSDDGSEDDEHKPQNGGEVRICAGCITRERKRASRKKHKKPEEDELWNRYEHQRVIVFNTQEIKDWQAVTPHMVDPTGAGPADLSVPDGTVQVDAPMRIACYCRHHGEKMGFQVIFTIKDHQDNVIAQQISSSIMITDDHKTHLPAASATQNSVLSPPLPVAMDVHHIEPSMQSFRMSPATSDLQGLPTATSFALSGNNSQSVPVTTTTSRNISRQGSPTSPSGPTARKRKASGSVKLPTGLAMTRLETGQSPQIMPLGAHNESAVTSAAASPFSSNMGSFPMSTESMFHGQQTNLNNIGQQYPTSVEPPTPSSKNAEIGVPQGSRNMSIDNVPVSQIFSTPSSAHPSRAPSPNRVRNDIQNVCHSSLSQNIYNAPTVMNSSRSQPMIYKIIPGEGPKLGGVEVTILGSGFTNGGLEVMFGEQRATTTTYWGETSLVCLLPPSPVAGIVPVSIRQPGVASQLAFGGNQQPLFRYVDDDEHRLIRTALTVLGNKLGNNLTDVADIARNIIYGPATGGSWGPSPGSSGPTPNANFNNLEQDLSESVEKGLLRILELIDLDDSANKAKINLRRANGQTMLHMASSIGLVRFVAGLLSRGANVGVRDKGGFTPLHLAAMNGHQEIVRRLIMRGADPNMRSLSGLTPADVARSSDVLRVLRQIENHSRSRSNGSLHSRANSASSLRSLWDPSPAHREEFMSESPSSSEDSSDDDDDSSVQSNVHEEGGDWLNMRRPSFPQYATPREPTGVDAPPATTTAAMAALREQVTAQFQQLQHSMTMHFQNLPHMQMPQMPQMPALPPIPVLPDYHAYLYAAPVMQRISSLVPNIRGQRPGSGDEEPPRDADSKWWDLSRFGVKDSPPPAYSSIFPQRDVDLKRATAAAAAAEAVADEKCAALFDQKESGSSQTQEVPALLEIGHKHSITKEQQEHLQRAHAQRLKTGSSDKMLWFVWIPILIFILGTMLVSVAPSLVFYGTSFVNTSAAFVANPREFAQRLTLNIVGTA